MKNRIFPLIVMLVLSAFGASATARVDFGVHEFSATEFRGLDQVQEACSAAGASSFFCELQDATLIRIPTKGVDFFFDDAGELVAAYSKQQKGQKLNNYGIDNGQNLIPWEASAPGLGVLVDGEYVAPEDPSGSWERTGESAVVGTFTYAVRDLQVTKTVRVSNESHTIDVDLHVERAAAAEGAAQEPVTVQLAYPGIANVEPVVKLGQGDTFSKNPLPQPVANPTYISHQNNDRNTAHAIVFRPEPSAAPGANEELAAQFVRPNLIAMQTTVAPGGEATLDLETYLGPNELVRYTQEGFADLPGLFRPNILGRMSLGILWLLQFIHDYVGSWGLSIIVLTLIFRVLIWPLITTQTKSMYGMQELQPKIQALQKKHKDDRETLTQETMKLYKEAGVNPAGGCLPIVLQMPLFIILWRVFVNFEFNEGFLWIPDLGQADPLYILPILYIGVMLGQSFFSARGNKSSLRQQVIINLVFAFIIINFPAGVILYFVVSMGVQIFQYWLIGRSSPQPAPAK